MAVPKTVAFAPLALLALFLLNACGSTSINRKHELFVRDPDLAAAQIYFIRPFTYRERGLADNPVHIEVNGQPLLDIGKGEYTFLRMKAQKIRITTRSLSEFTNKLEPVEMTRSSEIILQPDQRYFLHVKQVNEEFRGVYYVIENINLETAKGLVANLHSVSVPGKLAIEDL